MLAKAQLRQQVPAMHLFRYPNTDDIGTYTFHYTSTGKDSLVFE